MVAVSILGYVVTAAITIILTSGIWLAIGVSERKNYYTTNIYEENLKNTSISLGNCEELPNTKKCENTCEFVICESIPMGLSFDTKYPIFNKTTNCWMRLMSESRSDIILGSYYWNLLAADTDHNYIKDNTNTSGDGQQIYEALLKTAQRGVNIKIAQNYQKGGYVETSNLAALSNGNIQIRSLDFSKCLEFLDLAVMDYAPHTLYMKDNNFWYGVLDEAIRRAAFDRKVKVRFLCSRWAHTYPEFYSYLHSLQDLSSELPCLKKRTSNWTPDYWKFTAGIGLIIRSDDMTQSSFLVNQLQQIFNRDWESNYVKSILEFDNSGNLVNKTKEDLR
uniref:PLDc_3 domain-containing protein n=1 Tax=Heterorhabditis bacteriophora TaxID=37862 RepID=A0A1I7XIP1_HETBA